MFVRKSRIDIIIINLILLPWWPSRSLTLRLANWLIRLMVILIKTFYDFESTGTKTRECTDFFMFKKCIEFSNNFKINTFPITSCGVQFLVWLLHNDVYSSDFSYKDRIPWIWDELFKSDYLYCTKSYVGTIFYISSWSCNIPNLFLIESKSLLKLDLCHVVIYLHLKYPNPNI